VPLRDISEFHAWLERETPNKTAHSVARTFIAELGDRPWCGPSVPIAELSNQPEYEVRWMEENGRMRSTVARRLSTLASFYRYCEQEGLTDRNPAANVRRPKVDYESPTLGLDRNELGAFLVQAGLGSARDHALASLLALKGLRISEALDLYIGERTTGPIFVGAKGGRMDRYAADRTVKR